MVMPTTQVTAEVTGESRRLEGVGAECGGGVRREVYFFSASASGSCCRPES